MSELITFDEEINTWDISNKKLTLTLRKNYKEKLTEENNTIEKVCIRELKNNEIYYGLGNKKTKIKNRIWLDGNREQRREYHYQDRVVIIENKEKTVVGSECKPLWKRLLNSVEEFFVEHFFKTTFLGVRI